MKATYYKELGQRAATQRIASEVLRDYYNFWDLTPSPKYCAPKATRVIFNDPATIIYWNDETKTVVKCQPGDTYDKEKGFMAAYLKKLLGNDNTYNKVMHKWIVDDDIAE